MKIAILNTWAGGAVHNVFYPMSNYLNTLDGVECDYITVRDNLEKGNFDRSFDNYDIVHVSYFANLLKIKDHIEVPFTTTVHHLAPHAAEQAVRLLAFSRPYGITTADPFCQRQLGQYGVMPVHLIPYSFDHKVFEGSDMPITYKTEAVPFGLCYLGCDSPAKRFDMIAEVAAEMGIEDNGIDRKTRNEEEDFLDQETINKMYENSHVYVSAGWNDGGPLPPQEALLCGLPVITTRVGMMTQLIKPGVNGEFFDGTPRDLKDKLQKVKDNYNIYRVGAYSTQLPSVRTTSEMYMELWTQILEDEE